MDVRHTIYLVLLIFFILCSGFFSAVDMAYSAVKKSRLSKASKSDKNAKIALKLAQNYNQTIATILFGNDFVNILLSSLAAILSKDLLEPILGEVASSISSGVLLFILLLFGEILPKIFDKHSLLHLFHHYISDLKFHRKNCKFNHAKFKKSSRNRR